MNIDDLRKLAEQELEQSSKRPSQTTKKLSKEENLKLLKKMLSGKSAAIDNAVSDEE